MEIRRKGFIGSIFVGKASLEALCRNPESQDVADEKSVADNGNFFDTSDGKWSQWDVLRIRLGNGRSVLSTP